MQGNIIVMSDPTAEAIRTNLQANLKTIQALRASHDKASADLSVLEKSLMTALGVSERKKPGPKPKAAAPAEKPVAKKGPKAKTPAKAVAKEKTPAKAAPKAAAKAAPAKAPTKAKNGTVPSLAADTAVEAAGLPPRVVKFLSGAKIATLRDLSAHHLPSLVQGAKRLGDKALDSMTHALGRAGLESAAAPA